MGVGSDSLKRRLDPVLALIVFGGALVGALIVGRARNWAVMPDELLYVELARSVNGSLLPLPALQGDFTPIYQVLYPVLIAPLIALLKMPAAYSPIAVLNACALASAAIPAYLLAHRVSESRAAARWVALCCVVTPWLVFASRVMPEATTFAAVTWAFWAIVRTAAPSERPLLGDALTLLAIVVSLFLRNQFVLLFAVWLGAVVLSTVAAAAGAGGRSAVLPALRSLPRARPLVFGIVALGLLLALLRPTTVLGGYAVLQVSQGSAVPGLTFGGLLVDHVQLFILGSAVLPVMFGLPWLLTALTRVGETKQFTAAVVTLLASVTLLLVAVVFDLRYELSGRINERYFFYLAPLWFCAMAACFAHPPRSFAAFALPAVAVVLLVVLKDPYGLDNDLNRLLNGALTPTLVALIAPQRVADTLGLSIAGLVQIGAVVLGGLSWWAFAKQQTARVRDLCFLVTAVALAAGMLVSTPNSVSEQNKQAVAAFGEQSNDEKRWVSELTGKDGWALVHTSSSDPEPQAIQPKSAWRNVNFWNDGLRALYADGHGTRPDSLPLWGDVAPFTVRWSDGRLPRAPGDGSQHLLLAEDDPHLAPQGYGAPVVHNGFALYTTGPERRAAWATRGLTAGGWVPPTGAVLRVWAPRGAERPVDYEVVVELAFVSPLSKAEQEASRRDSDRPLTGATQHIERETLRRKVTITPDGHADIRLQRGESATHVGRVRLVQ